MSRSSMKKIFVLCFAFFRLLSMPVWAQNDLTLYHLPSVPQRLYNNPSSLPDCKFFISLPGIGNLNVDAGLQFLELRNINDLIRDEGSHLEFDLSALSDVFSRDNFIYLNNHIDLGQVGITLGKSFLHANIGIKNKFRLQYNKDLVDLLVDGNGGDNLGRTFRLSPNILAQSYAEVGLGYTRSLGKKDRFKVGTRLKFLRGLADASTQESDITFQTNPTDYKYTIGNTLRINTSGLETEKPWESMGQLSNNGMAIDLGFHAQLNKRLNVSGAINDLGAIRWKSNTKSYYTPNQLFTFDGVRIDNILKDTQNVQADLERYKDSFLTLFNIDTSHGREYTTSLPTYFYLGGTLVLTNNHRLGALICGDFFEKKIYPALTLSYNARLTKVISFSVSGSFRRGMLVGLGAGGAINAGPFQFYTVLDNIPFLGLDRANYFNIRGGLNLTFRRRAAIRQERRSRKKNKAKNEVGCLYF